ncbi:MAG: hypothetical protein AAF572_11380 [Cyanobacteria bacterium P01_B01_bin.77]
MDSQIIAALITGVFGLITGIAVSKADSIQLNFFSGRRKLRQNWRGFTQRIAVENGSCHLASQHNCTMTLIQRGSKISGEVRTESENSAGQVRIYEYSIKKGFFEGDYLLLTLESKNKQMYRIRQHIFYVHTSGTLLQGYFTGNRASGERVITGICNMESN